MLKVIKGPGYNRRSIAVITVLLALTTALSACHLPGGSPGDQGFHLLAFNCDIEGCLPQEIPKQPGSEEIILQRWSVDLTGDGLEEAISLAGGRLQISGAAVEPWASNLHWKVVSAAPGDPNDDGRNDILVALFKEGSEGALLSHPFIIGYRDGRFKTIWGGSAVPFAIFEVLLADVDGSGKQELVVLEAAELGAGPEGRLRTLSVWDWHGWGYNLRWRSKPGYYNNLNFIPSAGGGGLISVEESTGKAR